MFRFNFVVISPLSLQQLINAKDAESKEITSESVPDNNKAATIATATSVLALSDLVNISPSQLTNAGKKIILLAVEYVARDSIS